MLLKFWQNNLSKPGFVYVMSVGVLIVLFAASFCFINIKTIKADTKDELQKKIEQRNKDIADLEIEIANYQKQINSLSSQANSLSATIKSLDLSQKKLAADISLTENKIEAKNLEIQELGTQISNKEDAIVDDHGVISSSLSTMNQIDDNSFWELLLGGTSLASTIDAFDQIAIVQNQLVDRIRDLREVKADLEANKRSTERAKQDLVSLTKQLKDQRQVVLNTQSEKNKLLKETKQSESQYQKILAQKQAQKAAFDQEVLQYEAQLKTIVDLERLPRVGSGVLSWPLDSIFVTQYFGNTPFSTANPQIYNGNGHTGIDLRASLGTPVKAALSGTVTGVYNTDLYAGCYSYGKWIMIEHADGLSTLYAHLSLQSVSIGQRVTTGQIIGYSGNTGYSTGPHLHFGVYATQGVEIKKFSSSRNCRNATIPVASFNAYLNPLSYL